MAKKQLPPELEAQNVWVAHRIDDTPAPGYTTSVVIQNSAHGPLITFVGVGISPVAPWDKHDDEFPWYSDTSTLMADKNEAGVTARILKQLNITDVKQGAIEQLREGGESGYLSLDIAVEQIIHGLAGRTQVRDDKFKANLAAAYIEQIRETGSKGVYDELGAKLDYSPHTLRSYVKQIRDQGFLTPAVRGVAGGDLTDKSRVILGLEVGA
jgi:hypothetical protein